MQRYLTTVAMLAWAASASAADLMIGLSSEPSSLDPHYQILTPNEMVARNVFEPLVLQDEQQRPTPGLALSWAAKGELEWEFVLRPDVKWHDGTPFTAADVLFTLERAPKVPNSPASYNLYLKPIVGASAPDPLHVVIKTSQPTPLLPMALSQVMVVQAKAATGVTTADFNSGKAMVGTGPFRFVDAVPGDHYGYARNTAYWGTAPAWDKVTIKPITASGSRTAALMSGSVDAIDTVPSTDVETLRARPDVKLFDKASNLVMILNIDQGSAPSPFVTDKKGQKLTENPLTKRDVRKAISLAVNREAIISRTMEGAAVMASQMVADEVAGASPRLKPDPYDPNEAKNLLAKAGYPDGFGITIHCSNNRYVNDGQLCQALAQMLTRVGIAAKVETMPLNIFFTRAQNREFSLFLTGWGANTGEASSPLNAVLHTYDTSLGAGAANRGRYSNPKFDQLLDTAMATFDTPKREALLAEANDVAIADMGIIPLHVPLNRWATRSAIRYEARTDALTLAASFLPQ